MTAWRHHKLVDHYTLKFYFINRPSLNSPPVIVDGYIFSESRSSSPVLLNGSLLIVWLYWTYFTIMEFSNGESRNVVESAKILGVHKQRVQKPCHVSRLTYQRNQIMVYLLSWFLITRPMYSIGRGKNEDVIAKMFRLISVLYCHGNME